MRGAVFLPLGLALLVSACGGGQSLSPAQACGCHSYYGAKPRPAWVDAGDQISAQSYRTAGISECTGVLSYDNEKSELSARAKLSRMLAVRSDVRISETRKDYGQGAGYTQAQIEATQISQTLLQDSKIYDRWVDRQNCIIYAAAEISTANIEKQKAELARQEAARLINQSFEVTALAAPALILQNEGRAVLSELGVTRIKANADYALNLDFLPTERNKTALRGRLTATIAAADGTVVWSQTVKTKGVSYQPLSETELTGRAIAEGLERLKPALKAALMK